MLLILVTVKFAGENLSMATDRAHGISLRTDKAERSLTLEDTGLGMTKWAS